MQQIFSPQLWHTIVRCTYIHVHVISYRYVDKDSGKTAITEKADKTINWPSPSSLTHWRNSIGIHTLQRFYYTSHTVHGCRTSLASENKLGALILILKTSVYSSALNNNYEVLSLEFTETVTTLRPHWFCIQTVVRKSNRYKKCVTQVCRIRLVKPVWGKVNDYHSNVNKTNTDVCALRTKRWDTHTPPL